MSESSIGTRLSIIGQHYVLGRSRREIAKNGLMFEIYPVIV